MKKTNISKSLPFFIFISIFAFGIYIATPEITLAQTQTQTNTAAKTKTAAQLAAPEIDYTTLGSLDKSKLLLVIRCLVAEGVNTNDAISNCLPVVSKAPQNPLKTDISAVPTVKVIFPNGGEKITEGTTVRVRYSAAGANSVDIKLWSASMPTLDLATNQPAQGYYEWKVKAFAGYNTDYAIGVRAKNANGSAYDVSDTYIKIIRPSATTTTTSMNLATSSVATTQKDSSKVFTQSQAASAQAILERAIGFIRAFTY